jgi:L-cysteate sulfo-lyase
MERLSTALGGPRIWIKRDDCTGLGTGGNKTRKLEFLLGAAEAVDTETVITFGAVQSNHARQTAAACAKRGLECHLMLARKVPWRDPNYETLGNVLFDHLFGAHVHLIDAEAIKDEYTRLKESLDNEGKRRYVIPTGGSNGTGALGYAVCAEELQQQSERAGFTLTDIVHATSSAGTQGGLLAGLSLLGTIDRTRVHGINVSEPDSEIEAFIARIGEIGNDALALTGADPNLTREQVTVDSTWFGEGYGIPTRGTLEAVHQVAELEGVLLDPVYSGKAMSGLIGKIRRGEFQHVENVVFLHTGGSASLPVYGQVLDSA